MKVKSKSVIDLMIPLADAHQKADEYISGNYWDAAHKRGCAVGCSIADAKKLGALNGVAHDDHAALANATAVPEMLWRLADNVFEGLSDELRPAWTPRFLRAVKKSKDLKNAPARIMYRLAKRLAKGAIREDVKAVTLIGAELWKRRANGDDPPKAEWDAARQQADAARQQADAARQQADAARQQADAARQQADAAKESWWKWAADMVSEEIINESKT